VRDYELLLLIRPNLDRDSAIVASESIAELIKNRGGEIKSSNVWGRRRLAYPISDQLEATYILLKLKISPSALKDIDFELKLNESVLRFMIIKDELVDAAATEAITETEAEQPVEAEAETAEVSAEAQAAEEVVEEAAAEEETSEEAEAATEEAVAEADVEAAEEAEAATEEAVAEADVEAAEEAEEPETEATEAS
jgi:small subunit ribosomal protein S6